MSICFIQTTFRAIIVFLLHSSYIHNVTMFKKFALLLLISPLLSFFSFGQDLLFDGEKKFLGGLSLGMNMSQIDGDAYFGYNKLGFNGGGIVYWNFSAKIGASFEILYTRKGARGVDESYSPYVGPYFGKYFLNINYAELPLVVHYYITPKYHLGVGAAYAQLINSSERYEDVDIYYFSSSDYPFRKYNVDFVASASMVVWRNFLLNAKYQYSLTPIRDPEHVPMNLGYMYKPQMNNLFVVRAIYLF